jgi:FolB domain-containing protein
MHTSSTYNLDLNDLRYMLKIGCSKEERSLPQEISISINIEFSSPPLGCEDDNIKNTICYDNLSKEIENFIKLKEYQLIENLCYELHKYLKDKLKSKITVSILKKPALMINLIGGAKFTISG